MTDTKKQSLDAWVRQQLDKAPPMSERTRAQLARIRQYAQVSRPVGQ